MIPLLLAGVKPFNPDINLVSVTTLDAGAGANDWVGRASIVRRPSDNVLVMAYYKAQAHDTNVGALNIRFSDDHGVTWTAENTTLGGAAVTGFPMNPPGATKPPDAGEPQLYVAPNGDLLIHSWLIDYGTSMGGSFQSRSTDGGHTWPAMSQIAFGHPTEDDDIIFSTDDWFVVDDVIYAGARIYTGGADGRPSESILITSDDNGTNWQYVSTIMSDAEGDSPSFGGQEVGLEYIGNSTILAMIRDNPQTKSFKRLSTDMGQTWGTLVNMTGTPVAIAGRQRVYTLAHLRGEANWWDDPELLMCGFNHTDPPNSQGRIVCVWYSPDRGNRWFGPFPVDTPSGDGGYGDLFWNPVLEQWNLVSYRGTTATASLKQYVFTLTGI